MTNFSAQALSSFGDYSDNIISLDEAPSPLQPNAKADFKPETSMWKAMLSQCFNVRQILDIGSKSDFRDRASRLIVCILIGCIAFASNHVPGDSALLSRFYHAITRGLTDDTIDKTKENKGNLFLFLSKMLISFLKIIVF